MLQLNANLKLQNQQMDQDAQLLALNGGYNVHPVPAPISIIDDNNNNIKRWRQ